MTRSLVSSIALCLCLAACGTEPVEPGAAAAPSIEEALAAEVTLVYDQESGDTVQATAFVAARPRSLVFKVTMPREGEAALPAATLARLRADRHVDVTIAGGVDAWVVRDPDTRTRVLSLAEFVPYYGTSAVFATLCGDTVAKAQLTLATPDGEFAARVSVLHPMRFFGIYSTTACETEGGKWKGTCVPIGGVQCSAVVDCGTALGGTRRCGGTCHTIWGWVWNDCMCNVDEVACCNAPLPPPTCPVITEAPATTPPPPPMRTEY